MSLWLHNAKNLRFFGFRGGLKTRCIVYDVFMLTNLRSLLHGAAHRSPAVVHLLMTALNLA
jgi:hypothetical protein